MANPFADVVDANFLNWGDQSPELARAYLQRDLARLKLVRSTGREEREATRRQNYERTQRDRHSGAMGYGFMQPTHREPQYRPENPNQYMIDAIMRDQALQAYDVAKRNQRVKVEPDPRAGGLAWSALQGTPPPKPGDIQRTQAFHGVVKPWERLGRGHQFVGNQPYAF